MECSDDDGGSTLGEAAVFYAPAHTTREFQPCAVSIYRGLKLRMTEKRDNDNRYADLSKFMQRAAKLNYRTGIRIITSMLRGWCRTLRLLKQLVRLWMAPL